MYIHWVILLELLFSFRAPNCYLYLFSTRICLDSDGVQRKINFAGIFRQKTYSTVTRFQLTSSYYTVGPRCWDYKTHHVGVEGPPLFPGSLPDGSAFLHYGRMSVLWGLDRALSKNVKVYPFWMVEIVGRVILVGNGVRNTTAPSSTPKITHWKQTHTVESPRSN